MKFLSSGLSALALLTTPLLGCADQFSEVQPQSVTTVQQSSVKNTDPAISAVLIDLAQVEVHSAQGKKTFLTDVAAGSYNLLTSGNSTTLLFSTSTLPVGSIQGLRLVLGGNSKIMLADGTVKDLETPSGTTSGLKIQLDEVTTTAGKSYQVSIKFSVEKDIVSRGNGTYGLKPVLRGSVSPAQGNTGPILPN